MSEFMRTDIPGWGADLPKQRKPGVPREAKPHPAEHSHWERPERQEGEPSVLMTALRDEPTPVFGTETPPHGLSGRLRRMAYAIPDNRPSHWTTLLFADRVDVVESAVVDTLKSRKTWAVLGAAAAVGLLWLSRRDRER